MSTTPAASPLPAVVLGGGLAGLAAARLLRRHFPRVVVLERDRRPETAEPEDAFASWERRGGSPRSARPRPTSAAPRPASSTTRASTASAAAAGRAARRGWSRATSGG